MPGCEDDAGGVCAWAEPREHAGEAELTLAVALRSVLRVLRLVAAAGARVLATQPGLPPEHDA